MSCPYGHHDAAYVLGSLPAAERQDFERHLAHCPSCATSVREVAGLPGLLGRLDAKALESPPPEIPVPSTLLPSLVQEVRRAERRRRVVTVGVAVAAALTAAAGSLLVTAGPGGDGSPDAGPPSAGSAAAFPAGRDMAPVGDPPVRATLALERVPWGTRLQLTCTYEVRSAGYRATPLRYSMFVHTRAGSTEQVASWRWVEGDTMRLAAATAAGRDDIAWVEVRTSTGTPVLRLTV